MDIIRRAAFKAVPWKNGGGMTHEVLRVPAGGGAFRWRVSMAQIDTDGPFSDFAGFHRVLVLLSGRGLRLEFADGSGRELKTIGDMAHFDGALAAHCALSDGPCRDLNLMVAQDLLAQDPRGATALVGGELPVDFAPQQGVSVRSGAAGSPCAATPGGIDARVLPLARLCSWTASAGTMLIVPLTAAVWVSVGGAAAQRLERWDVAVAAPGESVALDPDPRPHGDTATDLDTSTATDDDADTETDAITDLEPSARREPPLVFHATVPDNQYPH